MYSHSCDCAELSDLADDNEEWDSIYTEIARQLQAGADLNTDAIYNKTATQLTEALNKGYGVAYDDQDSRKALQAKFKQNIEQFSYAKVLTQFSLFKDYVFNDKGQMQNFAFIKKAVADNGAIFNNNYLRAETQYVTQTAIMAHKWETMDAEYLEFTTVGDSRVRPEHKVFDKFTALKTDSIWKRLYTPLDWGCRCTIIPGISKNISKEYDSEWANKVVDPLVKGTIFDNNAALSGLVFTDKHPYFKANPIVLTIVNLPNDDGLKKQRAEIREWMKENLVGQTITHPKIEKLILFTTKGVKEALNQPHKFIKEKNEAIKDIKKLIQEAEFVKSNKDSKGRDIEYHYLKTKINNVDSFIVIKSQSGNTAFHSIVEKLKEQ